ncbi:oligosaccharide translocation protein RFT1 [Colletotrichum spaethianum]|uniref:Man(5)GlcNAc(2)-PP-dolichol translocation protein RFT1 n=1 Tax=Colletotrichum spaethianum TaxID=700344 RepID=A0AA37URU2_9PEZI|nr:oligosaccharide translocation protein RFT1 [Colletotrichum spaethianum]GKT51407.1 oligosaccharide translocation protein RFT1 [Colletotrichum spaethianum]
MSSSERPASASAPADASKTVVRGASLLIILQIGSRAVTFIANQLLLRFLTAQLLGVSTQLEVYYLSVLFFARESLRVAVQRQETRPGSGKKEDDSKARVGRESQAVVNLGYLAVLLGCFVTVGLGWLYLSSADESTVKTPNFLLALRLYAVAAVLELLSEPCFVLMQTRLQFGTRASAESIATFLRCIVTFGTAFWASRAGVEFGVLPFAVGQLSYGASLLLIYLWSGTRLARADGFSILPKSLGSGQDYVASYFYRPTVSLASSMMAQSLVKHVLTQGDTFLVSILSTPKSQGVYALASNYGGLLARLVLQPIEESSRSYFSRLLSSQDTETKPSKETAAKASQHLHTLLKFYLLLSSIIVSIGPVAAPPLLSLVAGKRWANEGAGEVLAVYCYYIPLLAMNGVAEAFVASVASEAQVHRQSAWMGAFSVAFGSAAFLFMRVMDLGASGLVFANCINMLCRIVWSLTFVKSYFGGLETPFELFTLQPNAVTSIVCLSAPHLIRRVTGVASRASSTSFKDLIAIGLAAVPVVLLILFAERIFLLQCYNSARRPKTA